MGLRKIFTRPVFGLFVTFVHITACVLSVAYLVGCITHTVDGDETHKKSVQNYVVILSGYIIVCFVQVTMCLILIVGILRKNHHLMAPWIATTFISLVAVFFYTLAMVCFSFLNEFSTKDNPKKLSRKEHFDRIIPGLGYFLIHVCLFYPIYVLYKSILIFRLKKEGLYEDSIESEGCDELADSVEIH
ncbi:uncharacterized protein LOC101897470 [Musca domestica]|uniref:Uncharacterized protein LOC101897470 n=1 Tax=Musca domestica TaxID=7370 RepID=A0A1I8MV37_MUSDO|nr:uncharacterized protein LOC101897470 [Musca domestica]